MPKTAYLRAKARSFAVFVHNHIYIFILKGGAKGANVMKCWNRVVGLLLVLTTIIVWGSIYTVSDSDSPLSPNNTINTSSLGITNLSITNKDMYVLGEPILIYVGSFDVKEVLITTENDNYKFIGELKSPLRFNPSIEISLVLPCLPLEITFTFIIPNISNSATTSETLLCVRGLRPTFPHKDL